MNYEHNIAIPLFYDTISFSEDDPISDADAVSETSMNTRQMMEDEWGNMLSVLLTTCRR
jgi:hypothetical protein